MKIRNSLQSLNKFVNQSFADNGVSFEEIALEVFYFQAKHNLIYSQYLNNLRIEPASIKGLDEIPFLPIGFFKDFQLKSGAWDAEIIFESSGTLGSKSYHHVDSVDRYVHHAQAIFGEAFGNLSDYHILALLPSYEQQKHSSLLTMINHFIHSTSSQYSGFYRTDDPKFYKTVEKAQSLQGKVLIWGVSYALLDIAEQGFFDWSNCYVLETGGMKGRRKELIRQELHTQLCASFNVSIILSEYGMTELLSQAYSFGHGVFTAPKWMKVFIRDAEDPFALMPDGKTGGINIVDLANIHSCSFIQTEDIGQKCGKNSFQVLGRLDNTDIRGCNLFVQEFV